MDFYIRSGASLPTLKILLISDGRPDFYSIIQDLSTSSVFFSMVNSKTGIPKVVNQPCIISQYLNTNGELEYFIEYQFEEIYTDEVGLFKGEITVKNTQGVLILTLQEELDIYVLDSITSVDTCCPVIVTPSNSSTPPPTPTPTQTPTNTTTNTNTPSNTPTSTQTPTNTQTNTITPTNTPSSSITPTNTPSNTNTPTNTSSVTSTPTNTPTNTQTVTPTSVINIITIDSFFFMSSIGAGFLASTQYTSDVDIDVNFTSKLGTTTGNTFDISTSVRINSGTTSGFTQLFLNGEYGELDGSSIIDNITIVTTGVSQYIFTSTTQSTTGNTFNATPTQTPSQTATPTFTQTPTTTETPTPTTTENPALTLTNTPTPTSTPSVTPTLTPTNTRTQTVTPTNTRTQTATPSVTPSNTRTPSQTPSNTRTPSQTPSNTSTPSVTPSNTVTPTFTPTNTLTPTPTPTTPVYSADSIYNALSLSAQTTYTATTIGDFMKVSLTDWNNVSSAITGSYTYGGLTDAQFSGANTSEFVGGFYLTDSAQSATTTGITGLTPNNYVIGFRVRAARNAAGQNSYSFRIISGGTINGNYVQIGGATSAFTNTVAHSTHYFIRKAPQEFTVGASSYLGFYFSSNVTVVSGPSRLCYYGNSPGPWGFSNNFTPIAFQSLIATGRTW